MDCFASTGGRRPAAIGGVACQGSESIALKRMMDPCIAFISLQSAVVGKDWDTAVNDNVIDMKMPAVFAAGRAIAFMPSQFGSPRAGVLEWVLTHDRPTDTFPRQESLIPSFAHQNEWSRAS